MPCMRPTQKASARTLREEASALHSPETSVQSPETGTENPQPGNSALRAPHSPLAPLPELLPVRMLNEFTYCPRLGYLEWVQGEWAENLETLQGTFGHRNVDKPTRGEVPAPAAEQDQPDADRPGPAEEPPH